MATVQVVSAIVMAAFAVFVWRTYEQIAWFTGSMESRSAKQLQLAALNHGDVKLVWWDPTEEPWPLEGPHGADAKPKRLVLGMHPELRKHRTKVQHQRPIEWDEEERSE